MPKVPCKECGFTNDCESPDPRFPQYSLVKPEHGHEFKEQEYVCQTTKKGLSAKHKFTVYWSQYSHYERKVTSSNFQD